MAANNNMNTAGITFNRDSQKKFPCCAKEIQDKATKYKPCWKWFEEDFEP